MQYRIKEEDKGNGTKIYYPQYKEFLFWRRFVWWGGEDGTFPHTQFCLNFEEALQLIEEDKKWRKQKALEVSKKSIYHYVD